MYSIIIFTLSFFLVVLGSSHAWAIHNASEGQGPGELGPLNPTEGLEFKVSLPAGEVPKVGLSEAIADNKMVKVEDVEVNPAEDLLVDQLVKVITRMDGNRYLLKLANAAKLRAEEAQQDSADTNRRKRQGHNCLMEDGRK